MYPGREEMQHEGQAAGHTALCQPADQDEGWCSVCFLLFAFTETGESLEAPWPASVP